MKLSESELVKVKAILTNIYMDNIKSVSNEDVFSYAIVAGITRMQVIELDRLLGTRGISIHPNDDKTIKIML